MVILQLFASSQLPTVKSQADATENNGRGDGILFVHRLRKSRPGFYDRQDHPELDIHCSRTASE